MRLYILIKLSPRLIAVENIEIKQERANLFYHIDDEKGGLIRCKLKTSIFNRFEK